MRTWYSLLGWQLALMLSSSSVWAEQASAVEVMVTLEQPAAQRAAEPTALLAARPAAQQVTITSLRHKAERVPRQRDMALSEQHLVIVALDADHREISRETILDPRLIRAETADAEGTLTSAMFYRSSVSFPVVVPDEPRAAELRFLQPRWTGQEMVLDLIASVPVP